jgi:hypothetical protein
VLFVSVFLKHEQMSAQFRHEEYAERLEAGDENSVKECMEKKLEGKDEGRFEVADEFAEER